MTYNINTNPVNPATVVFGYVLYFPFKESEMHLKDNPSPVMTEKNTVNSALENPQVLEEIVIEELSIDGICGVY